MLEVIAGLVAPRRAGGARRPGADRDVAAAARVPPWQRQVGLLRQDPGLFPHLSVRANLAYGGAAEPGELAELAGMLGSASCCR